MTSRYATAKMTRYDHHSPETRSVMRSNIGRRDYAAWISCRSRGGRVIDVPTSLAGPYCTEVLAALGADVIKVEPPAGDEARTWGPPFWNGESTMFLAMNAGKRSVALELRERGADVVLRLVERADVFVQSLRPGLQPKSASTQRRCARGTLASSTARSRRSAAQAPGPRGRDTTRSLRPRAEWFRDRRAGQQGVRVSVSLVNQGTGMWAALGVLAALMERERTGEGRTLDVSLYETAIAYMAYHVTGYLGSGRARADGDGVSVDRAVPGLPHRRRRGHGGRGQRPAVRSALRGARAARASGRRALRVNPARVENREVLVPLSRHRVPHEGHG